VAQAIHFKEELAHQFHVRFPELLGLAPWPATFFAAFNLSWLAAWSAATIAIARFPQPCAAALWFLALASTLNGVAHPVLSLAVRGYFPSLWTSVLVGLLGVALIRRLASAPTAEAARHHAA
jgi:hypothetical protein